MCSLVFGRENELVVCISVLISYSDVIRKSKSVTKPVSEKDKLETRDGCWIFFPQTYAIELLLQKVYNITLHLQSFEHLKTLLDTADCSRKFHSHNSILPNYQTFTKLM